jgi:predicted Zn-dependent peptidase
MFEKKILKNNLRLITVPIKGTKAVTVLVLIKAGSRNETDKIAGISHFTEHMFFKGTKKRPNNLAIATEIDSVGGEINAFTTKEFTGYFIKIAKKHTEKAMDVLSDMLENPEFRPTDIEKEKPIIIQEYNMYEDTPVVKVGELLEQSLYQKHPLGRDIIGFKNSILNINQKDFQDYYKKLYKSENVVIVLSGAVKKIEELKPLVEKYFSFEPLETVTTFQEVVENQKAPQMILKKQKTEQVHLGFGVRGYDANDDRKYILEIISAILGGGMSSRLFSEIREKRSLAYYVKSENQTFTDAGYLYVQVGVDQKNLQLALKIIIDNLEILKNEKVSSKELKKVKEFLKGRITMHTEDSFDVGQFIGLQELLDKETKTPEEVIKMLDKVSVEDIQKTAQELFINKNLNLAVIAPKVDESLLKKILKI